MAFVKIAIGYQQRGPCDVEKHQTVNVFPTGRFSTHFLVKNHLDFLSENLQMDMLNM